jgi:CDP-glycerol glycerophosphotransferase (TagB/SpsB family)
MLAGQEAVMVVKPHPWAAAEDMPDLSHIRVVTDEWLGQEGLTLHGLLGESCALVTDISSVYVDYLLLDRPIVHHFPNIRAYGSDRGYSISPVDDYLAGPLTLDSEGFQKALSSVLSGEDTHADQRRRVRALFHTHTDGEAAARLLGELGLGSR